MRYHSDYSLPEKGEIFVFGSNLAGHHGAGAARAAKERFGARLGIGFGLTGNSYAIPTKDAALASLPLHVIRAHITEFLRFARTRPSQEFFVTRIGCGLAEYRDEAVAPLFRGAPSNCSFPKEWQSFLEPGNGNV